MDRVSQKLKHWKAQFLIPAGKVILVQSSLAAMPQYVMSCFSLPASMYKSLDYTSRSFFWSNGTSRQTPTIAWSTICQPKNMEGLDIKKSTVMNLALLAKKGWELLVHPSSLWHSLMKKKYFPHSTFLHAKCPVTASWGWKSICLSRDILLQGAFHIIGDGQSINPWSDYWIPNHPPLVAPFPIHYSAPTKVLHLTNPVDRTWRRELILQWWPPDIATAILSIFIPIFPLADKIVWCLNSSGKFFVVSAYHLILNGGRQTSQSLFPWHKIWNLPRLLKSNT
ncbi:uncharacterized mitochondrial protein AtMg00310-like [Macadamia integrifolia]|uniref:uncharacterized mitochondrial protein AtMg00310-like n=1 Tax=Macadamia integrifolia TaxID=60698 RepID=UPI001C4F172E|nr:uncharacterized mitochondrial protein AtMg00310-like [Macadamia integrifolia]